MTQISNQPIRPIGDYTTAVDSVRAIALPTIAALGAKGYANDFGKKNITEFLQAFPFVDIIKTNDWLLQGHTIEDGESAFTWDGAEYEEPKHGQVQEGLEFLIKPIKIMGGYTYSVDEMARHASNTDEFFQKLFAEKEEKMGRDYANGVRAKFMDDVLNVIDKEIVDGGVYLSPDGTGTDVPLIGAHTNKNGVHAWDNAGTGAGVDLEEMVKNFVLEAGQYSATSVDTAGQTIDMSFDTFIVPMSAQIDGGATGAAGSIKGSILNELTNYFNVDVQLNKLGAMDVANYFDVSERYPTISKQVNIYANSNVNIIAVKGMDEDLIIAMDGSGEGLDSSEAKPIKFVEKQAFTSNPVHLNTNGSISVSGFGFVNFGVFGRGRNLFSTRIEEADAV